jgi:transketolase
MADVKKIATRDSYGNELAALGAENPDIVVMDADLSGATKTAVFKKAFPDRFFNAGIAEGNMVSVAAGLSTTGKVVFASSFAMFAAGRAFEQVRNSIGYPHLNVKIAATHAGISVGEDGATHQCCEDIALMRSIPGMVILNPADDTEARKAVRAAAAYEGPVYLRFGRLAVPVLFDDDYQFEIGKGVTLQEGQDVTIIATGLMVGEAVKAGEMLKEQGISARVINMATIKPIDKEIILKAAKETGAIVTAEEHNIIGGLGSAVAEVLCENLPVPMLRVGVEDTFGKSGPALDLLPLFGLSAENIVAKAQAVLNMKK